jgi:hypothetical protein
MGLLIFDRTQADGMYLSVMCAEDYDFEADELDLAGVRPQFVEQNQADIKETLQVCADWGVPQLGPQADEAVVSDIPALLFSGNFDPVTPPPYGDTVAQTLSQAYKYVFPANGHGAFLDGGCSTQIMRDFLYDPDIEPDAGCVDDRPAPVFATPANTLMSPGVVYPLHLALKALTDPTSAVAEVPALVAPGLVLLGLLLFPLAWFVGWLINLIRKAPRERRWLARLAPWLGVLLAILALTFVVLQLTVVVAALSGDIKGYVGIDRSFAWVYIFPLLIAVVAAGMALLAVLSWVKDYWGPVARVYYSLTALAALVYTAMLAGRGLMAVLL